LASPQWGVADGGSAAPLLAWTLDPFTRELIAIWIALFVLLVLMIVLVWLHLRDR